MIYRENVPTLGGLSVTFPEVYIIEKPTLGKCLK